MNFAPYLRLLWKEYRAIRLFWLSLAGMTVLLQLLSGAFSSNLLNASMRVYGLALLGPALFALGAAGASFAVEVEDGTLEFLRGIPVRSQQLVVSKLLTVVLATLAMALTLWMTAIIANRAPTPGIDAILDLLGLWGMAAVEAVAWGTLFSILTARPMVAICLAMAVGSTFTHFLAWTHATTPNRFEMASYDRAMGWRLAIAAVVFAADVALGLRWLRGGPMERRLILWRRRGASTGSALVADSLALPDRADAAAKLPDRHTIFGHLLWQHWRQSRGLMLFMGVLGPFVLLPVIWLLISYLDGGPHYKTWVVDTIALAPFAILITLVGCCVFLPDQEQLRYRFFVEHNVPPQSVWLTRQLPWLVLAAVLAIAWCAVWVNSHYGVGMLWRMILRTTEPVLSTEYRYHPLYFELPPIAWAVGCIATAYAAGQWASMHVRSGIMAGFCGLAMAAGLCGWVSLMHRMQVSWWWSVLPIPLLLLWSTCRRAREWIDENRSWRARAKTAGVLLVPAAVLLFAVPVYRVRQIPPYTPGFDVQAYLSEVPEDGLETAEMYRKANVLDEAEPRDPKDETLVINPADEPGRPPSEAALKWLHGNRRSLELVLEATQRPHCVMIDPRGDEYWDLMQGPESLISLLIVSGRELEAQGKLDEALERYLAALRCDVQTSRAYYSNHAGRVMREIAAWGAAKGQTPQRLRTAMQKLQATGYADQLADEIKTEYAVGMNQLREGKCEWWLFYGHHSYAGREADDVLWDALMPWERTRAAHLLNLVTQIALLRLQDMQATLQSDTQISGVARFLTPVMISPYDYFSTQYAFPYWMWSWPTWPSEMDLALQQKIKWLATTWPQPDGIGERGVLAASAVAWCETARRATLIVLALDAYRLEHGKLPEKLDALKDGYLPTVPVDPYSGRSFVYFPSGVPRPKTFEEVADVDGVQTTQYIDFGQPCLWSTGSKLEWREQWEPDVINSQRASIMPEDNTYVLRSDPIRHVRTYAAWARGHWFEIPSKP